MALAPDIHVPVLPREVVAMLSARVGEVILDCTAGLGGHAAALAEAAVGSAAGAGCTVVLTDLDPANLAKAEARVRGVSVGGGVRVHAIHASFVEAPRKLNELGLAADVVLADLGFSSNQLADPGRGFSFSMDGPLDMRLNPQSPITAAELVNTLTERELASLLSEYGEESHARAIARNLVRERAERPIGTTAQFASIVREAVPARDRYGGGIDAATKSFQALRIAVNDELGNLAALLTSVQQAAKRIGAGQPAWMKPGARVGIISFHSLEDRQVKQSFGSLVEKGLASHVTRKAVQAGEEEIAANPRARSAKFRVIRVGADPQTAGSA